jgi:hypothetical protein
MFVTQWSTDISDSALVYGASNTTAKRPGTVSCYPAAFAKLPAERAKFRVHLTTAPRNGNTLSFGLAKRGMQVTNSDGVGRTTNTWGVADDRNSSNTDGPVISASATKLHSWSRKWAAGDILSAEVNTTAGWCEIALHGSADKHRFTIPTGSKEDYWFAMTFATDHVITILPSDSTVPPAVAPAAAASSPPPPPKRTFAV